MSSIATILEELNKVCQNIDTSEYDSIVAMLAENRTFYLSGEGRSGLVAKAIAMRLMHGGKSVHVVGETTTPAMKQEDVLLILSGSGQSNQTLHLGKQAHKNGATVFLVTANKKAMSPDWCAGGLHIPAATKHRLPEEPDTIQPLGNQFDQSAHIILDAAIIDSLLSIKEMENMKKNHANFE